MPDSDRNGDGSQGAPLNPIEEGSRGYLCKHLPHYLPLCEIIQAQLDGARRDENRGALAFWNALHVFIYMIFENLGFLHLQLQQCPSSTKNSFNVYQHLPTFMATISMAFPISEYMRRAIFMLSLDTFEIGKNQFTGIISRRKREKESQAVTNFLEQATAFPCCADIETLWSKFSLTNDLRHTYTHGFRLPWWPREGTEIYGFPMTIASESSKIKDEIWEYVTDANLWTEKVSHLDESDFVKGADLITEVHKQGAKLADRLFQSFIEYIKQKLS